MPRTQHLTQVSPRWAFWKWFDIPDRVDPSKVYLRRLRIIQTPRGAVYLHWIFMADGDRDPHDHPWNFWSLVIRGGYLEKLLGIPLITRVGEVTYPEWGKWSFRKMPRGKAHSILTVQPGTITLVFTGKRSSTWGFYTKQGFVPFDQYDGMNAGPDPFDS